MEQFEKKKFLRLYEPIDPCVLRALRCVAYGPVRCTDGWGLVHDRVRVVCWAAGYLAGRAMAQRAVHQLRSLLRPAAANLERRWLQ